MEDNDNQASSSPADKADEEEDLSQIEWGAGLTALLDQQMYKLFAASFGFSVLGLPSFLLSDAVRPREGIMFPSVLGGLALLVAILSLVRWCYKNPVDDGSIGVDSTPLMEYSPIDYRRRGGVTRDASFRGVIGTKVTSGTKGLARFVMQSGQVLAFTGYVCLGWTLGLTTYCAHDKSETQWQACYELFSFDHNPVYGMLVTVAMILTVACVTFWFLLWKVVRQYLRGPKLKADAEGRHELPQTAMFTLAFSVGVIAGTGAWVFRKMISLVHNALFNLTFSAEYIATEHTPRMPDFVPEYLIILAPVVGGVIVVFLVGNFAPEAKGHGVPEVMDAIHYKEGLIRPTVAGVKILASSFSIGSGGSVGREGPIIQIGSTFGSMVGTYSKCSVPQRVTLVACGAAGGIAATFNTPIGGIVFAMELMLPAANSRTLMPLGLCTVIATYFGRVTLGVHPAFDIKSLTGDHSTSFLMLLTYFPFGVLVGLASVLFVKGIYWFEDFFESLPGNYYSRHCTGCVCQGLLIYSMMFFFGHYYVQGVGYATIEDVLRWDNGSNDHSNSISNPVFCLLLFMTKFLSTNVTIGSGASGGIFSPSLFVGSTLGAAWGHVLSVMFGIENFDPIAAVVAGMAGMVGGSTGASVTAITMTFEMTRDYSSILPIIITTVLAHMTRKAISEDSIYTLKLVRRGHVVPEGLQAAVHAAQRVQDVMSTNYRVLSESDSMTKFAGLSVVLPHEDHSHEDFTGRVHGAILVDYAEILGKDLTAVEYHDTMEGGAGDLANFIRVLPKDDLHGALQKMHHVNAHFLLVTSTMHGHLQEELIGVVSPADMTHNFTKKAALLSRDRSLGKRHAPQLGGGNMRRSLIYRRPSWGCP